MLHGKEQRNDIANPINAPLKIDVPGSAHEKEAELFASNMMRNGQVPAAPASRPGQIAPPAKQNQDMIVPPSVQEEIESSKGGGDKLSDGVKRQMKGFTSDELDDVHIHTDGRAAQLSKAVNANAFTHGKDIYFGAGKFDTYTADGKQLLAHELMHTQQSKGWGNPCIQRSPDTWGGEWTEEAFYQPEDTGMITQIHFYPNENVDATVIGLTQTVRNREEGKPYVNERYEPKDKERSIGKEAAIVVDKVTGETDEATHIDQDGKQRNPMYWADNAPETDTELYETKPPEPKTDPQTFKKSGVRYGKNYWLGKYLQTESAMLWDTPYLGKSLPDSSQVFETTAIALDGKQKGRYYGSVEWGWKRSDKGVFSPIPMKVKSEGVPSTSFLKAAEKWNSVKPEGSDKDPLQLPLVDVKVLNQTVDAELWGVIPKKIKLEKGTRVNVLADAGVQFVEIVQGDYTYQKARILGNIPNEELFGDERKQK